MEGEKDEKPKVLLEIGCGIGNLVFPLLEENLLLYLYCCDFSPCSVQFVKEHKLYSLISLQTLFAELGPNSVDLITCIFAMPAIHPNKHHAVFDNLSKVLRPGGVFLFRDYGLYDMAIIRFKPGSKIGENFYLSQASEVEQLGLAAGRVSYQNQSGG